MIMLPKSTGIILFWYGNEDGDDEIYLYQISIGTTRQISSNTVADGAPKIYGDYVIWHTKGSGGVGL